ncbi:hypothetical protein GCM10010315_20370 [Streptomyces luteosporeus]|uniref:PPE domain-containing protein n=1 Tax=Streptomyces luteosporeus TaxID=173856 RepID=A0ABP6G3K1_9ACTN
MTTPVGPVINQPVSGLFTTSDFESKSHEELRAMVANADPGQTRALSEKLSTAAAAITRIGTRLKEHMAAVHWEGEGGDAFRTWGANMANSTLRLGDFAKTASTWMGHAASTLSDVKKAMPDIPAADRTTLASYHQNHPGQVGSVPQSVLTEQPTGLQPQGPTQQQAYAAQQRLEKERLEAARLMRQLAESYSWSTHNLQTAPRPTFPPPPRGLMPDPRDASEYIPAPSGRGTSGSVGGGNHEALPVVAGGGQRQGYTTGLSGSAGGHVSAPDLLPNARSGAASSHLRVDGGLAVPHVPAATPGLEGTPQIGGSRDMPVVPPVPHVAPGPATTRAGGQAVAEAARGIGGGRFDIAPGMPERGAGRGRVPLPGVRLPGDGIVGGRGFPRTPNQLEAPATGGTVGGAQLGQGRSQAASPMGYTPAHGAAPGGPAGRAGSATPGRRLATNPGGVVGGTAQRRPGASGNGTFTPGGMGLVRGPGEPSRSQSRTARKGQRPDYLVEDEATWDQTNRRVVPPVID